MKKYDKVDLSSEIYRDRPYAKISVPALKLLEMKQHDISKKKMQNVHCPNCRYYFKVQIDQQQIQKQKKVLSNTSNKNNNTKMQNSNSQKSQRKYMNVFHKQMEVQTEQYLLGSLKTSPKKQIITIQQQNKIGIMTDRTPQKKYKLLASPTNYNQNNLPLYSQRKLHTNLKRQLIKTEISTSRNHQINKSNGKSNNKQSIQKDASMTKKQLFPAKTAYLGNKSSHKNESSISPLKINQKISNIKTPQKHKTEVNISKQNFNETPKSQINADFIELKTKLTNQLLQKIYLSQQIGEIIQYQMNLPQPLSVPSYCKMLAYELKDQKQLNKKNIGQINQQLRSKIVIKDTDQDLPKFSTRSKNNGIQQNS